MKSVFLVFTVTVAISLFSNTSAQSGRGCTRECRSKGKSFQECRIECRGGSRNKSPVSVSRPNFSKGYDPEPIADVQIINTLSESVSGIVRYATPVCANDPYTVEPGKIWKHSRGACLITGITGQAANEGPKCKPYSSSGSFYAAFQIIPTNGKGCEVNRPKVLKQSETCSLKCVGECSLIIAGCVAVCGGPEDLPCIIPCVKALSTFCVSCIASCIN